LGTAETERIFVKMLQETGMMARWSGSVEGIQNLSWFSIL